MQYYTFEIMIEKGAEGEGYYAYSTTLPGCFGRGATLEEAKQSMRIAVQQHIETLRAHGEPIPQNERLTHVQELTVGVP